MLRLVTCAALAAACSYPEPPDVCDGECQILAVDRPITTGNLPLTIEGTFEDGTVITFPGGGTFTVTRPVSHRAFVQVPADASAGLLTLSSRSPTHGGVPYRHASFELGLQRWSDHYEQGDVARTVPTLTRPRNGSALVRTAHRLHLIGGLNSGAPNSEIETAIVSSDGTLDAFVPQPNTQALRHGRGFHSAHVIGGWLYVVGGFAAAGVTPTVERAQIAINGDLGPFEIITSVNLKDARAAHASAIIGNYLYVFGGTTGTQPLGSIERAPIYNAEELGDFEPIGITALPRSGHSATVVGERVYLIGGNNGANHVAAIEVLPLEPNGHPLEVRAGGSMMEARAFHSSVLLGSWLYQIGGEGPGGSLRSVERADVATEQLRFEHVAPLSDARQGHTSAVVGNQIYVFGGVRAGTPVDRSERAQIIRTGTLEGFGIIQRPLKTPRVYHATVVVGNNLYVLGGKGADGKALGTIEHATIAPDGTLSEFAIHQSQLVTPRWGHTALVAGNHLYITGGDQEGVAQKFGFSESAFLASDGTLSAFASNPFNLQTGRVFHSAVVAGHCMFMIGGTTDTGVTASVERATIDDQFRIFFNATTPMPVVRSNHKVVSLGNTLYVVSGTDGTTEQGILQGNVGPNCDIMWSSYTAALQTARRDHSVVVLGSYLYAIGGLGALNAIERTIINADGSFLSLAPTQTALGSRRAGHTLTVIGDYVYLIGGFVDGTASETVFRSTIR